MVLSVRECWEYLKSTWPGKRNDCQATILPLQVPTQQWNAPVVVTDQIGISNNSCPIDPFAIRPITFAHWSGTNRQSILTSNLKKAGCFYWQTTGRIQGFSRIEALGYLTLQYTTNEEMRKRKAQVAYIMRNSNVLQSLLAEGSEEIGIKTLLEEHIVKAPNPDDAHAIVTELHCDIRRQEQIRQETEQNVNHANPDGPGQSDVSSLPYTRTAFTNMETLPKTIQRNNVEESPPGQSGESQNVSEQLINENHLAPAVDHLLWFSPNPHMRSKAQRKATFDRRWPAKRLNILSVQLAEAGFFYLGDRDRVKCWFCDGILQNWEPNDEPWEKHAQMNPGCHFLLQCKGKRFIDFHLSRNIDHERPISRLRRDNQDRSSNVLEALNTTSFEHLTARTSITHKETGSHSERLTAFCEEQETIPMKAWTTNGDGPAQCQPQCVSDENNLHDQTDSENGERSQQALSSGNEINVDSSFGNGTSDEFHHNQESTCRIGSDGIRGHHESAQVLQGQAGTTAIIHRSTAKITDPVGDASVSDGDGEYVEEIQRRTTFDNFPGGRRWPSLSVFWGSGFYYTGNADRVKCCFCGRIVENWGPEDNPSDLCWHRSTCRRQQEHNERMEQLNNEQQTGSSFNGSDAANSTQIYQRSTAPTPRHEELRPEDDEENSETSSLTSRRRSGSVLGTSTESCCSSENSRKRSPKISVAGTYTKTELKNCRNCTINNYANNDCTDHLLKEIKNIKMMFVATLIVFGPLFYVKMMK